MELSKTDILNYIKPSNLRKQPVFVNMASLGLLQIANYIIPIVVIPFVVRALGADSFGKASYAQNIIAYLTIIVNYGFEYSATQEVAINRENHSKLISIFWTVIKTKLMLLLASFVILGTLYFTFPKVHEDPVLYLFAALVNIGFALFPTWFFQGMEKMAKMAALNFAIRITSGTLTILLITVPEHYRYYLLISSTAYIVVGFIAFCYVIGHYKLMPEEGTHNEWAPVKKGFPIFLNNIFATLYTTAGFTILGLYCTDAELGIYSGAYKIIMAFVMLTSMPITLALFPNISRKFNESRSAGYSQLKKSSIIVGVFAITITVFVFFAAPLLVSLLLGSDFTASTPLLRAFSPLPFLIIMASMFTVQGLYGLQLQKYAPYIGLTSGIVCITLTITLFPVCGYYSAIIGYLTAELTEIMLSASVIRFNLRKGGAQ